MNARVALTAKPASGGRDARLRWAFAFHRPYMRGLVVAAVLVVLRSAAELPSPLVYRFVIDSATSGSAVAPVLWAACTYGLLAIAANALGAI